MGGYEDYWPNVEERFFEDLKLLIDQVGSLDLVLFTGDLAFKGDAAEFALVNQLLEKLWTKLRALDSDPRLLAVPGNHDLVRPTDEADSALINLLHLWDEPIVQNRFWDDPDSEQRKVVDRAFANYVQWWQDLSVPKPQNLSKGLLPGDFSVTIEKDGFKLGILGLNTSFLQLAGDDRKGKMALSVRQFNRAGGGHGPDWANEHDACLLLSHHPPDWLTEHAQQQLEVEIHSPAHRFALHLFGHMHNPEYRSVAIGGPSARRRLQGCSMFAAEGWTEGQGRERLHGYSAGQIESGSGVLRIWPRRAVRRQDRTWIIERDSGFDLPPGGDSVELAAVRSLRTQQQLSRNSAEASRESYSHVGFLKAARELEPEDFNFKLVSVEEALPQDRRLFYEGTYISRTAVPYDRRTDKDPRPQYSEEALRDSLRANRGFVLLGPPLDGKSRTLYEIVEGLGDYAVLRIDEHSEFPEDDYFASLRDKRIVVLLDDLTKYVDSEVDLFRFCWKLGQHVTSWVVAATCRDGPELSTVRETETKNLKRFYEDIPSKLSLLRATHKEKNMLAQSIGRATHEDEAEFPTLGHITMEEPMRYMRERYQSLSVDGRYREHRDTLRALKLLDAAGVLPFHQERVRAVVEHIFHRRPSHLSDCLDILVEQGFLMPGNQEPVQPEYAYLREVVTYVVGKDPADDFDGLAEVLEHLKDDEGLFYLGTNRFYGS